MPNPASTSPCRRNAIRGNSILHGCGLGCFWDRRLPRILSRSLLAFLAASFVAGCAKPNQTNILLRKQNQKLGEQIAALQREHLSDKAMISALQARSTTIPSLASGELDRLFTVHGIKFGRLTGGYNVEGAPKDAGIKIYIVPFDESNQPLKSAGSFVIEAFDLSATSPRIGRWTFSLEQARQNWYGYFLYDYYYVLTCPWQMIPQHGDLTIKVTFVDELTKLAFSAERQITVNPPPTTVGQATTNP